MASSFLVAAGFFVARKAGMEIPSHVSLLVTVAATTVVWVAVTLLAPPTDRATLRAFYERVRPAGPGWDAIRRESGLPASPDSLPMSMLAWVLGCCFVYAALFGAGSFLYGRTTQGVVWLVLFLVSGGWLWRLLPRIWGAGRARGR